MRNQTALASWPFASASSRFFLIRPARPQASTSQRARHLVADAVVAIDDAVLAAVVGERDVAHRRAAGEADAAPRASSARKFSKMPRSSC